MFNPPSSIFYPRSSFFCPLSLSSILYLQPSVLDPPAFSVLDITDLRYSLEPGQEPARLFALKHRVTSLNAQEETIATRHLKAVNVEHRMIRLRQSVQRQHPEHRENRSQQNRALECDRDERGPTVQ